MGQEGEIAKLAPGPCCVKRIANLDEATCSCTSGYRRRSRTDLENFRLSIGGGHANDWGMSQEGEETSRPICGSNCALECAMCDFDAPVLPADLKKFRLSGGPI